MKFSVTLDRDEDGAWAASCLAVPGCVSQGESRRACLEVRAERGLPLTVETSEMEVTV